MAEEDKRPETLSNKNEVDAIEGNVCVRDLWKGENEPDAEFMHIENTTDPLE